MPSRGLDEHGRIATEVSLAKIQSAFAPVVEDARVAVERFCGNRLASLYLYGSVAAGRARWIDSDLDLLVIFREPPSALERAGVEHLASDLSRTYAGRLREVGLAQSHRAEVYSPRERYGLLCFIKHLCVRLSGEDLTRDVPPFAPTDEVARAFNGDVAVELASYRAKIVAATDPRESARLVRSLSKKILRTGFSLVRGGDRPEGRVIEAPPVKSGCPARRPERMLSDTGGGTRCSGWWRSRVFSRGPTCSSKNTWPPTAGYC